MKNYIFLILIFLFIENADADEIILKSGGKVKGIILEESTETMEVQVKSGKVRLKRDEIDSINKNPEENKEFEKEWLKTKEAPPKIAESQPKEENSRKPAPKPQPKKESQKQKAASKYKTGEIFEVKCEDKVHSYAVCLPKNYDGAKRAPVLFCFDPGGDGRNAVRQFMFASDKYGWIVVGSNDAKNGPWEPIQEAQRVMLSDIRIRFNVDNMRFYAGGFSGGARMSYTIAYKYPMYFKGVIPCGAGFGLGSIAPRVAVFQCVGKDDAAAQKEIKDVEFSLKEKRVNFKIKEFSGGHLWPPREVLEEAIDWIAKE